MAYLDFIEVIPADPKIDTGYWAVIEGRDGKPEIIDDCFDTEAEAEAAGRAFKQEVLGADRQQQHEAAWQAGMAMGCDAYNDYMGYS